mgnify:CR=1 FL=1
MSDKCKKNIVIIDYGIGNLLSVTRAVEFCGANPILTDCPNKITNADRLILPGVGAFSDGMKGLADKNLIGPINDFVRKGNPFMGICLGMQMMLDESDEFGINKGLGLISGKVTSIPKNSLNDNKYKIPHTGWNSLESGAKCKNWQNTILQNTKKGECVYFVHSFYAIPKKEEHVLATCSYAGKDLCAVVNNENIYGCQFHPEKSGAFGISILGTFCNEL